MRGYCRSLIAIPLAAIVCVAGCALVPEEVSPARQACRDLGFSDEAIDIFIDAVQEQQDDDIALGDTLEAVSEGCSEGCVSASCLINCPTCVAEIVDQVYD